MKVSQKGIINSNINHFCSPHKFTASHIHRINPDKSTFLNSNLTVSNILNHLPPTHLPQNVQLNDAYINREEEMLKHREFTCDKKERINRVKQLAKCRSQDTFDLMRREDQQVKEQVDKINQMRIEVNQKARDIMSRKEDTAYLGRNLFLEGERYLKKMKSNNPIEKVNKLQATRMLMKDRAKTKGRNIRKELKNDGDETSNGSMMQSNQSFNSSSLDISMDARMGRKDLKQQEKVKDQHIASMIRNGSFESVLNTQKRHAAWQSFNQHWALGFKKNEDVIITKKKRKAKRSPKQKYVDVSGSMELDYHDKMSRYKALKNYRQTFQKTGTSYQIMSH